MGITDLNKYNLNNAKIQIELIEDMRMMFGIDVSKEFFGEKIEVKPSYVLGKINDTCSSNTAP